MIQFNLLPDIKLEFIRTRRLRRTIILISAIVASVSLIVLVLLVIGVTVIQKKHLNDLSSDINTKSQKLQGIKDLDKILTIQNQLNTLTSLHDKKFIASRLPIYLQQITPAEANMSNLRINFDDNSMTITGSANSLETVNKFVDTLKFTPYTDQDVTGDWKPSVQYKAGNVVAANGSYYTANSDHSSTSETEPGVGAGAAGTWQSPPPAFSKVVLTTFARDDKIANYTIDLTFESKIFVVTNKIQLLVPKIITTRSETEKPGALFQPQQPIAGQIRRGQ